MENTDKFKVKSKLIKNREDKKKFLNRESKIVRKETNRASTRREEYLAQKGMLEEEE